MPFRITRGERNINRGSSRAPRTALPGLARWAGAGVFVLGAAWLAIHNRLGDRGYEHDFTDRYHYA